MMNVRIVRVSVFNGFVYMSVGMGLLATPIGVVLMLVMRVMDVRVFVFQGQMAMHVRVVFREMQPHSGSHEESGDN